MMVTKLSSNLNMLTLARPSKEGQLTNLNELKTYLLHNKILPILGMSMKKMH